MENRNLFYRLFSFKGRMSREPFWIAYLVNTLAGALLVLMFAYMTNNSSFVSANASPTLYLIFWGVLAVTLDPRGAVMIWMTISWSSTHWLWILIWGVLLTVLLINRWALIARRFHDTNHSFTIVYWGLFLLRLGISTFLGMILPVVSNLICWGIVIGILVILLQRSKKETESPVFRGESKQQIQH